MADINIITPIGNGGENDVLAGTGENSLPVWRNASTINKWERATDGVLDNQASGFIQINYCILPFINSGYTRYLGQYESAGNKMDCRVGADGKIYVKQASAEETSYVALGSSGFKVMYLAKEL